MRFIFCFSLMIVLMSCKKNVTSQNLVLTIEDDFTLGYDCWVADFAECPVGEDNFYELQHAHCSLPTPLDTHDKAIFISGNNHSDDLLIYLTKPLSLLEPNTNYNAKFEIHFASEAPSNWAGAGGAPGEGVVLLIGVLSKQPQKVIMNLGSHAYYQLNFNKDQYTRKIGNVANGKDWRVWTMLMHEGVVSFTTDSTGRSWLFVASDSGFEATTSLYYSKIKVTVFK